LWDFSYLTLPTHLLVEVFDISSLQHQDLLFIIQKNTYETTLIKKFGKLNKSLAATVFPG
jgi:hypothetical protein